MNALRWAPHCPACWALLRYRWRDGDISLAHEQRRLAAIVAADVAGCSRLMGRDETGALIDAAAPAPRPHGPLQKGGVSQGSG